jgi:hypothetical protein
MTKATTRCVGRMVTARRIEMNLCSSKKRGFRHARVVERSKPGHMQMQHRRQVAELKDTATCIMSGDAVVKHPESVQRWCVEHDARDSPGHAEPSWRDGLTRLLIVTPLVSPPSKSLATTPIFYAQHTLPLE